MWALATAAAQPFSHRLHRKLGLECLSCHPQAAVSAVVTDNLLPSREACAACHKEVTLRSPAASLLTKFSHAQHVGFGNIAPVIAAAIDGKTYVSPPGDIRRHLNSKNACAACHRGIEESDQVTRAHLPQMADCIVCHPKIDPPFSCRQCHAPGPHLMPADHTANLVDTHSSGKLKLDKASCVVCHGRRFTCLGCH